MFKEIKKNVIFNHVLFNDIFYLEKDFVVLVKSLNPIFKLESNIYAQFRNVRENVIVN